MIVDERLHYLGTIPHAQRSILLVSAAMALLHPMNSDLVQRIRAHHGDFDGEQVCIQILLDLMMSIAGKWNVGSSVLLPVSTLIGNAVSCAGGDHGSTCPLSLAEKMWELIERVHDQPEMPLSEVVQEPSCN